MRFVGPLHALAVGILMSYGIVTARWTVQLAKLSVRRPTSRCLLNGPCSFIIHVYQAFSPICSSMCACLVEADAT